MLVAHRPGFVAPTLAARTFATMDQLSGGRVAVHTITGGSDTEQRRDGDYLGHDERYSRTDEYLTILRRAWTSSEPFSFDGAHYKFEDYATGVLPYGGRHLPLFFGGSSAAAYEVGGKHADTFMLWGEPLAETSEQIESVRAAADGRGTSDAADQRLLPADHRADRGARLGARAQDPGQHPERTGQGLPPDGEADDRRQAARRTRAPAGCSPPRPRATCTTGRSGPRPPRRPVPVATRPRWSAARRRSRWPCWTTSTSASTPS